MKDGWLIYGCYGYTGKLIAEYAVSRGLKPTLAGRDRARTEELANKLGLPFRVFEVENEETIAGELKPFKLVLHCAGPFKYTAGKMARACIAAGTHYLDITGEYEVFEKIFRMNEAAVEAGVLLLPGVGFDVVPSDCMALYLKEKLPTADTLELALLQQGGKLSHGTAITVTENLGEETAIRQRGRINKVKNGSLIRTITIGGKERQAVAISWGDVASAYRSTGIPNIIVFNMLPPKVISGMKWSNHFGFLFRLGPVKKFLINRIKKGPAGPSEEMRKNAKTFVWGEATNGLGITKQALLELPEGYTLTYLTAVRIVERLLEKAPEPGAKTPAQVFGKDFIMEFEGVKRKDLK